MDPRALEVFLDTLSGKSTGEAIEAQERREQRRATEGADRLPIKLQGCTEADLEAMGIQLGGPIDDLFRSVVLPEGWQVEGTGHAMWNKVLDEKGRERASFFYKGAFYDRDAFLRLAHRFHLTTHDVKSSERAEYADSEVYVVTDGGKVVWKGAPVAHVDYDASRAQRAEAEAWLAVHYPDWKSPTAYWD